MKASFHISSSVWSHRDFRLILAARSVALAAVSMAMTTVLLRVHGAGHGAWSVAVVLGCFAAPTILAMGWAGRLADTGDSRRLLVGGGAVEVVAAVGLALDPRLVTTCAMVLLLALGQAVTAPVWSALVPRVVGDDRVGRAIAWQQGVGALAGPAGGAAAGVLYQADGGQVACWVVAGASVLVLLGAWAVRTRRHLQRERQTPTGRARPLDGVRVVRGDALLWPLFVALLVVVVLVEGVNAAEVFLARDAIGASPAEYGLVELASALGGMVGAAAAGALATEPARVRGMLGGFAVACGGIAAAGLAGTFWVYLALLVAVTAGFGVGQAAIGALVMTRTPDAERGTVQSGLNGLLRLGTVVALSAGGTATTLVGPRAVFTAAGLAGLAALAAAAAVLVLRRRDTPPSPEAATPTVAGTGHD